MEVTRYGEINAKTERIVVENMDGTYPIQLYNIWVVEVGGTFQCFLKLTHKKRGPVKRASSASQTALFSLLTAASTVWTKHVCKHENWEQFQPLTNRWLVLSGTCAFQKEICELKQGNKELKWKILVTCSWQAYCSNHL